MSLKGCVVNGQMTDGDTMYTCQLSASKKSARGTVI